jgi:hypothetical protein
MPVAAVPEDNEPEEQLEWTFEGLAVSQSRANPGAPGEFAAIGEDGKALKIDEGDIFVVQTEYICTSVEIGAGYKGAIQTKSRKRTSHGKALEGTQEIVGLRRRNA